MSPSDSATTSRTRIADSPQQPEVDTGGHVGLGHPAAPPGAKQTGPGQVGKQRDAVSADPAGAELGGRPLRTVSTNSDKPYSVFSKSMKWFIIGLVGIAAVFSPISSNIFVPAIPVISRAFNRSEQDISLAVTIYLVFQAITPSFLASASDTFGRRPLSISTLVVYMGANVGLALCPTNAYWLLLVLRALQATGGSCLIAIGAGCVVDVSEPRERGSFTAIFQLGAMIGPAFGPLLGGVFAETLGWRAIFWFLVIATGIVLTALIFFLPETLRSLVGDGSVPPPMLCCSPQQLWQHHQATERRKRTGEEKVHTERPPKKKYQPLSSFKILLNPEITLVFWFVSVVYLEFYAILTVYSTALKDTYGLNELQIGLCYLPGGFGIIVSAIINGRLIDMFYQREERRAGGDYRKKGDVFRLEYARFRVPIPFLILFFIACISLGWCLEAQAHLAATLVVYFFVGLGSGTINLATVYGQDLMPGQGGAVSASLNLVRCIFGAIGTAVIQIMYERLNAGWTFVLLTGLCIVFVPMPVVVWRYGPTWRLKRREKSERKTAREKRDGV